MITTHQEEKIMVCLTSDTEIESVKNQGFDESLILPTQS